jgi:hypothetical protein
MAPCPLFSDISVNVGTKNQTWRKNTATSIYTRTDIKKERTFISNYIDYTNTITEKPAISIAVVFLRTFLVTLGENPRSCIWLGFF